MADIKAEDFARLVTLAIPAPVTALAFSNDGTMLAVAAADKVHIYKVPGNKPDTEKTLQTERRY